MKIMKRKRKRKIFVITDRQSTRDSRAKVSGVFRKRNEQETHERETALRTSQDHIMSGS